MKTSSFFPKLGRENLLTVITVLATAAAVISIGTIATVEFLNYKQTVTQSTPADAPSPADPAKTEKLINVAKQLAAEGRYRDAIGIISQVQKTDGSSYYQQSSQLLKDWSGKILAIANRYYSDPAGRLGDAIWVASAIQASNPLYQEAQSKITAWKQEWAENTLHLKAANKALDEHKPEQAQTEARLLTSHPFWQRQAGDVLTRAAEQQRKQFAFNVFFWATHGFIGVVQVWIAVASYRRSRLND